MCELYLSYEIGYYTHTNIHAHLHTKEMETAAQSYNVCSVLGYATIHTTSELELTLFPYNRRCLYGPMDQNIIYYLPDIRFTAATRHLTLAGV